MSSPLVESGRFHPLANAENQPLDSTTRKPYGQIRNSNIRSRNYVSCATFLGLAFELIKEAEKG